MQMIEISPSKNDKESGIRGLKQILEGVESCTYIEKFNLLTRYLLKVSNRMEKAKTPLTKSEMNNLVEELMIIIVKLPE